MGGITEIASSAPGYSSIRPKAAAPLAETLKLNGYSTAQFGKCHECRCGRRARWARSTRGPPAAAGSSTSTASSAGDESVRAGAVPGHGPIEPERTPEEGYHFTEDMTDRAIAWVREQKALMPDKPFFVYYAPGATHAPHHVPSEWSAKYKGEFDQGWDRLREETLARQKELGVVPEDAELTARPAEISAWDETPDAMKPILARQMEVYAGFLEHTDHHVGRLLDALGDLEILDDTLIYLIVGDNGASAEGTPNGCFNELVVLNGAAALETVAFMTSRIDDFGTPKAYNHYAVGWAHAMDTPFQWTKQVASHWGGTRNGAIVHWPKGFAASGEVRSQFHHIIDVAATILDAAGLPEPTFVNGIQQMPLHGVSMTPSFDDAESPERVRPSTSRCSATAASTTRAGLPSRGTRPVGDGDRAAAARGGRVGALCARRLDAGARPRRGAARQLEELQRLFMLEAGKYNVFPLDDRRAERFNADLAGRPQLVRGNRQLLFGGMDRLTENSVVVLRTSHMRSRPRSTSRGGAEGVIIAQGGPSAAGASTPRTEAGLLLQPVRLQRFKVYGRTAAPGSTRCGGVRLRRRRVGQGRHLDAVRRRDERSARGESTRRCRCSSPPTRRPISGPTAQHRERRPRPAETEFTGRVKWVAIDLGDDAEDADHLITPEERLKVAMARQ
jgi:arylsulfatase